MLDHGGFPGRAEGDDVLTRILRELVGISAAAQSIELLRADVADVRAAVEENTVLLRAIVDDPKSGTVEIVLGPVSEQSI